jgi:hypothetical protein
MKRILTILGASWVLTQALCAQILTADPGFSVTPLFPVLPNADISGLGSDSSGNLYYLDTANFGSGLTTELIKQTAASNYSSSSVLYNYNGVVYGSFVKVSGSTVYFGESSANTIQSISVNGGTPTLIATVPYNYDMAFNGTSAFVDASDSNYQNNTVSKLNLTTGALTPILNTGGASGPIAFTSNGSLLFGGSDYGDPGGIYSFSAAQVSAALTGTELTLSQGTLLFANGVNSDLASLNPQSLYQVETSYDSSIPALITLYNPANLTSQVAGQIDYADEGDIFDGITPLGGGVAVAVSSQDGYPGEASSQVFLVTPEPGSVALLAIGAAWMIGMRPVRSKRRP